MEDYKEKYEMALETVQEILDSGADSIKMSRLKLILRSVFSELKESDEEIRKALIELVKCNERSGHTLLNNVSTKSMLAWLKKQGKETITDNTNKVETKFKVGDWIITPKNKVLQITNIEGTSYVFNNESNYWEIYYCDKQCRLWTIADAEDGDILSYITDDKDLWIMIYQSLYKPYTNHVHYRALLVNDDFTDKGTCCIDINYLKPATKEQRDLLFKRMLESGYKWDADKKELINIL